VARIGVDLGGTKVEAVLMGYDGAVEARERIATPRFDYDATIDAVAHLVEKLDRAAERVCTVGAGTPGAVEPSTGLMKNCNSTWLNGRPLLGDLIRRLGDRVRIANDADCFALSESVDGAAAGARIAFGVILGTGVGGGIVVDGRLLQGRNGIAGEWGHTPLPYLRTDIDDLESRLEDRRCYCGRINCVETFLSGPGFAATHAALWGESREPREIAAAADANSARTLELYCRQLARSLAQIINVIDPDIIVLGGGVSEVDALYRRVPDLWRDYVFSANVATRLVPARHGASSGVRGAACLWPADYNSNST
jgi:predicted NBD/HSP70 family sugar kinase